MTMRAPSIIARLRQENETLRAENAILRAELETQKNPGGAAGVKSEEIDGSSEAIAAARKRQPERRGDDGRAPRER